MARDDPSPFLVSLPAKEGCAMSDEHFWYWLADGTANTKIPRPSLRFNFVRLNN